MPQPVDLAFDCEVCRLEGGAVETYDPLIACCRFGLPARTVCRLCAHETRGIVRAPNGHFYSALDAAAPGNVCPGCAATLVPEAVDAKRCPECGAHATLDLVRAGVLPATTAELLQALTPWAQREGFDDFGDFFEATFVQPDPDALLAALSQHERIETVPDPFDRQGGGRGSAAADAKTAPKDSPQIAAKRDERKAPPPSAPPRAVLYPLVSVIAADGEIDPRERALVDRFLISEGLAPLRDEEIRVHSPAETAPLVSPSRRHAVVQLMCETASIDGAADAAEIRVIRAYAGAWGVDDEQIDLWLWAHENMTEPFARQMWKKIRRFVLSSRWEQAR